MRQTGSCRSVEIKMWNCDMTQTRIPRTEVEWEMRGNGSVGRGESKRT